MGRASVPTPALYPAFFFVLEKAVKSAGNAVIPTFPMHRSHGLQGFLKRCYTPLPYFHQWVSHIKRVLAQSSTNGPCSLSWAKVSTRSAFGERSHTRVHTAKQGAFRMGVVSLPSERSTRFGNPAWPGGRTANFAAFGAWSGGSQRTQRASGQRCAYARRCPEGVAAPLGCAALFATW